MRRVKLFGEILITLGILYALFWHVVVLHFVFKYW